MRRSLAQFENIEALPGIIRKMHADVVGHRNIENEAEVVAPECLAPSFKPASPPSSG